jgi:hypothetical protein
MGIMVDLITSCSGKDVVMDRSHYGERVWAPVYGRDPLLSEDDISILREIEDTMECTRILLHDPNSEAHWQRCVENQEPLTKSQFVKARALYSSMADKYGFERKTLKDFPDAVQPLPPQAKNNADSAVLPANSNGSTDNAASKAGNSGDSVKTKEQNKLDRANAINEVLSKRIIKSKGPMYDDLERNVRHFLNGELGKIFGNNPQTGFSDQEVELLKFFCQRLKEKE